MSTATKILALMRERTAQHCEQFQHSDAPVVTVTPVIDTICVVAPQRESMTPHGSQDTFHSRYGHRLGAHPAHMPRYKSIRRGGARPRRHPK